MALAVNEIKTLTSLSVKYSLVYLQQLINSFVSIKLDENCATFLKELLHCVPPNYHAEFLDKLGPVFDSVSSQCLDQNVLEMIDDLALLLISPSITEIDVDKYQYPSRNPSKYLIALEHAKNLRMLVSYCEATWKNSLKNFEVLTVALTKMSMLRYLTLRHVKIPSSKINELLLGLAENSPQLLYLDLKYTSLTDSGLDPNSLDKFGDIKDFTDCIPALLMMVNLQHLNVSETWLTYVGVKSLVRYLPLKTLEAVMDNGYDLQAVVIKDLVDALVGEETSLSLARRAYRFAIEDESVHVICKACPLLEHVIFQDCSSRLIKSNFLTLSTMEHLKRVSLCGLDWTLFYSGLDINEDPMPLSTHVTEVMMTEPSCADAYHLGALSICLPKVTHLWVLNSKDMTATVWDGGRVFSNLTHLYYNGTFYTGDFCRFEVI